MARRVDEGDAPIVAVDLVRADVLRDAARLARDDVGVPDRIEQRRLAVVHVTHDRDDGRTGQEVLFVLVLVGAEQREQLDFLFRSGLDDQYLRAQRLGDELDHLVGKRRSGRHHLAGLEQDANEVGGGAVQPRRVLLDRGAPRNDDFAFGNRRICGSEPLCRGLELLAVATALLPAPRRRTAGTAPATRATAVTAGTTTRTTARSTATGCSGARARTARSSTGAAEAATARTAISSTASGSTASAARSTATRSAACTRSTGTAPESAARRARRRLRRSLPWGRRNCLARLRHGTTGLRRLRGCAARRTFGPVLGRATRYSRRGCRRRRGRGGRALRFERCLDRHRRRYGRDRRRRRGPHDSMGAADQRRHGLGLDRCGCGGCRCDRLGDDGSGLRRRWCGLGLGNDLALQTLRVREAAHAIG